MARRGLSGRVGVGSPGRSRNGCSPAPRGAGGHGTGRRPERRGDGGGRAATGFATGSKGDGWALHGRVPRGAAAVQQQGPGRARGHGERGPPEWSGAGRAGHGGAVDTGGREEREGLAHGGV